MTGSFYRSARANRSAASSSELSVSTKVPPASAANEKIDVSFRDAALQKDQTEAVSPTGAAVTLPEAHPHTSTIRERQTSPRTPCVDDDSSSPNHALAQRAASSFQQERRLQHGHIKSQVDSCAVPTSPTWVGLPDSVLHATESPTCLPLATSNTGVSHAGHTPTHVQMALTRQPLLPPKVATEVAAAPSAEGSAESSTCQQQSLVAEDDEGDVEYKWRLTGISATRFQHLVTQMQFRVSEGRGQCLYELGVSDDGTPRGLTRRDFDESVRTIQRMAAQLQLEVTVLQCCAVSRTATASGKSASQSTNSSPPPTTVSAQQPAQTGEAEELLCGEIMVSRRQSSSGHDLSVAFCGAVGCGKSTLMAVLLTARLDDGCGGTRQSLFNHKHELDSGRTSSLASRVWTVPQDAVPGGQSPPPAAVAAPGRFQPSWFPAPPPAFSAAPPTPPFTCASPRSITLLDAGGDITKTMLFGLMSRKPDYVCVCVAADTSDVSDVSLYAEVCCAMNTPFLVAMTKCDCVEEFELDGLMMELTVALDKVGCEAEQVESMETAAAYCRDWLPRHRDAAVEGGGAAYARLTSPTAHSAPEALARLRVPVFCVSSVAGGVGLDLFRSCLSHLQNPPPSPPLSPPSYASKPPFEVLLDCAFEVDDVGPVVHGRVSHGPVEVGCTCYIGPGSDGRFYAVVVRGIHVDGGHVNMAQVGDEATFALDRLPKAVTISHKGKVLVRQPERVTMAFEAAVQVLSQSISTHMEPIMYTRNARQAVNVEAVHFTAGHPSATSTDEDATSTVAAVTVEEPRECMVHCRFLFRPEVVGPGDAVVLHWAPRGIAVGRITVVEASSNQ